jgi:hypothetical protein
VPGDFACSFAVSALDSVMDHPLPYHSVVAAVAAVVAVAAPAVAAAQPRIASNICCDCWKHQ